MNEECFAFTEWVGLNYIRLSGVWCHKHKPRITTIRLKNFMTLGKNTMGNRIWIDTENALSVVLEHGEGLYEKVEEHKSPQRAYLMGVIAPIILQMLTGWGNMFKSKNEALKAYLPSVGFEDFDIKMASDEETHRLIVALTADLLTNGYFVPDADKYYGKKK